MSDIITHIPGLGPIKSDTRLVPLDACSDGVFTKEHNGVSAIFGTGDRKSRVYRVCGPHHRLRQIGDGLPRLLSCAVRAPAKGGADGPGWRQRAQRGILDLDHPDDDGQPVGQPKV